MDAFPQLIDHANPAAGTFMQRFTYNLTYVGSGAAGTPTPLFLTVGGEMDVETWAGITAGQVEPLAREFGAAMAALEHRLLGLSLLEPGSTANLSTLDPVVATRDVASAIPIMLQRMQLPPDTPVVLFGCSYSGMVAAYSHNVSSSVVGVVASSAPVQPLVDMYQYHQVLLQAFADPGAGGNQDCAEVLQAGVQDASSLIASGAAGGAGFATLSAAWNMCSPVTTTEDAQFAWYDLVDVFLGPSVVQENAMRAIRWACNTMQQPPAPNPRDALARLVRAMLGGNCLAAAGERDRYVNWLANASQPLPGSRWDRQYWYLQCAHLGWMHTCATDLQCPFAVSGFDALPVTWYEQICLQAFNITPSQMTDGVRSLTNAFGGANMSAINVAFINGGDDPWHVLSILPATNRAPPSTAPRVLVPTGWHCADMSAPQPTDPTLPRWYTPAKLCGTQLHNGSRRQPKCNVGAPAGPGSAHSPLACRSADGAVRAAIRPIHDAVEPEPEAARPGGLAPTARPGPESAGGFLSHSRPA